MENENIPEGWGNPESRGFSGITLDEIENLCAEVFDLRETIQKEESRLSDIKAKLRTRQEQLIHILNEHGKSSYKSKFGQVIVVKKLSVKCPKEPESRKVFFDYLKDRGIFEDLITVHSQTLNAFYKNEWDAAKLDGVMDYKMPGIGEPTYYETMQMRKG